MFNEKNHQEEDNSTLNSSKIMNKTKKRQNERKFTQAKLNNQFTILKIKKLCYKKGKTNGLRTNTLTSKGKNFLIIKKKILK